MSHQGQPSPSWGTTWPPTVTVPLGIDATELNVVQKATLASPASTLIVDTAAPAPPAHAEVTFRVAGFGATALIGTAPGVDVTVDFFYEGLGSVATEGQLGAQIKLKSTSMKKVDVDSYEHTVSSDDFPSSFKPGIYQLAAAISFPTLKMFAFIDGTTIQVL